MGWSTKASGAVRLVFLMAVPATDATQYLRLISGLARLAQTPRLVQQLHAAQTAAQVLAVLQQVELRPNPAAGGTRKATG